MAASQTVPQLESSSNLALPRSGVVSLYGFGIRVCVERGHLILPDGIGADRRYFRLPRVGHGLKQMVIGAVDGSISLSALEGGKHHPTPNTSATDLYTD